MSSRSDTDDAERREDAAAVGSDTLAAGVGAAIGLVGRPPGSIVGAVVAPGVARALRAFIERSTARQWDRADRLIKMAAKLAGVEVDVLFARLQGTPDREELLLRTLRAAGEASAEHKLVALAKSLASWSAGTAEQVQWESVFVRVIADLDGVHIDLLDKFRWSAKRLGLGEGDPAFDTPPTSLNGVELEMVVPHLKEIVDSVLATLVRHGLLAYSTQTAVTYGGGTALPATWALTSFGADLLDRLELVGDVLEDDVSSRPTEL